MPRKATGTVEWVPADPAKGETMGHWRARISLADGSRPWIECDPSPKSALTEARARERAAAWTERARAEGRTGADFGIGKRTAKGAAGAAPPAAPAPSETCDAWFQRYLEEKKAKGKAIGDDSYRWNGWIKPRIGDKAIAAITRTDVEDVRDALDAAIAEHAKHGKGRGRLAPKTAMNVWSVLTSAMSEAVASKKRELRVRTDNPCADVKPPEKGPSKKKTFVYPCEFLELVSCEAVPLAWREVYAVAAYLYLRPGELRVLTWGDVDDVGGYVSITKAWDNRARKVKPPKTANGIRKVPIPPTLIPLLRRMRKGTKATDLVVPLLSTVNEDLVADTTREHLRAAGVNRPRLFEETATTMQVNFRSWRDTGITWLALAGVDAGKILRRAGHDDPKTTLGYIKEAEDLTGAFGEPFPRLPLELVGEEEPPQTPENGGDSGGQTTDSVRNSVPAMPQPELTARDRSDQSVRRTGVETEPTGGIAEDSSSSSPDAAHDSTAKCAIATPETEPRTEGSVHSATPVSRPGFDVARALALAAAAHALLGASGDATVRALLGELVGLLQAAQAPAATVLDLAAARGRRGR